MKAVRSCVSWSSHSATRATSRCSKSWTTARLLLQQYAISAKTTITSAYFRERGVGSAAVVSSMPADGRVLSLTFKPLRKLRNVLRPSVRLAPGPKLCELREAQVRYSGESLTDAGWTAVAMC